jgi:EAL domain-containing protein (putative c-di-GMP-specific phosphodiesterase class I)
VAPSSLVAPVARGHESAGPRVRLGRRIEHAIDHHELFVDYQPVVAAATGELVAREALVRWRHPKRGVLGPATFIPMIEHRPVIELLTAWVVGEVAAQAARWRGEGACSAVSLNVSASLLAAPNMVATIANHLDEHDLPTGTLTTEVTESFLVHNTARAVRTMHQLGELGVRRSIDDFGTGYTSLRMLKTFPIDELKIDHSFVAGVVVSPVDRAIVASLVELGHRLGLTVVGEGVESEAVAAALIGIGCDRLQGYFVGRPGPGS